MKALIQRVTEASVVVEGKVIGEIGQGLLVLLGVESPDADANAIKMVDRLIAYRVFSDTDGKMNLSLKDIAGSLLIVSQFTLAADTKKGLRPGFSTAAKPHDAQRLYQLVVSLLKEKSVHVETGEFAADMDVRLVNNGPVTFMLET